MDARWEPARLTADDASPRIFAIVTLLIYMFATGFVTAHHEPWRDEADAWLVVRDLPLLSMIPHWTSDAGTPALWYVALKPLVKAGLPFAAENALNLIFAWTAAAILLFLAPLTRVTKILLLASYCFAFEYPVIARSYALSIMLLFAAAAAYRARGEHPLRFAIPLALAANTNVHAALIAGVFFVVSLFDRTSRRLVTIAVIGAGLFAALLQLAFPSGGTSPHPIGGEIRPQAILMALSQAFFGGVDKPVFALAAFAIVGLILFSLRQRRDALVVLSLSLLALLALLGIVIFNGVRHSGLILVATVVGVWIAGHVATTTTSRMAGILFNAALLFSAWPSVTTSTAEIRFAFSGAKEMAGFIRANGLERMPIAAHNLYTSEAILPWLPATRPWYAGLGDYGTYMKWDLAQEQAIHVPYEIATRNAQQHFGRSGKPWLLLLNIEMPNPQSYGFRLIHRTSVPVFRRFDERYWLYESTRY